MKNERNWSLLLLLLRFHIHFSPFFVLLVYFVFEVSFATTTRDESQFQDRVRLSYINVKVPSQLKFKIDAISNEWRSEI